MGQAIDEIGGAVYWVYHPQAFWIVVPQGHLVAFGHFFTQHGIVGNGFQALLKGVLRCNVSFGKQRTVFFAIAADAQKTWHHLGGGHFFNQLN